MILTKKDFENLKQFPFYSQEGKDGEAIAAARLTMINHLNSSFYLLEYSPDNGGEVFAVSNFGGRYEYGYYSLAEFRQVNKSPHFAVKFVSDKDFTPTALKNIPDVVRDMQEIWAYKDESEI